MARQRPVRNDIADLRCFAALLTAHGAWEIETGQPAHLKSLREFLWFNWEAPRRPGQASKRGWKYATGLPWSAAARAAYRNGERVPLVSEHREPVKLILRELLASPAWDVEALRVVIDTRVQTCVITKPEDEMINAAGFAQKMPPGQDVWGRYRAAGLDVDGFAPLEP